MIRANAVDGTRGWFVYVGALVLLVFLSTLPGVSMADN